VTLGNTDQVEIVLTALTLGQPGGMQTYLLTIAPQLQRLGHDITLFSPATGLMSDMARERGLQVAERESDLPESCDAVISSDAVTLLAMADRYPSSTRLLVVHSAEFDVHLPPGYDGTVSCAVAMSDAVALRLRAMAGEFAVERLHQPIDTDRYRDTGPATARPRRVLMLGNYLTGRSKDALCRACEDSGLQWRQAGGYGEVLADPTQAIKEADIVIGQGRSVLDAMACGRAAWVYGPIAGDGWVTESTYPGMEADGFRGRATDAILDAKAFGESLKSYDSVMGEVNRKLVTLHHSAYAHAIDLVALLDAAPTGRRVDAPLRELARTIRAQLDAQSGMEFLANECRLANDRWLMAQTALDLAQAEAQPAADARAALLLENARLAKEIADLRASRRWQLSGRITRPLEVARRYRTGQ
jgi:hypothetical protein